MKKIKISNLYRKHFSLEHGATIEREHEKTYNWLKNELKKNGTLPPKGEFFARIASDHLQEFPDYYTLLWVMEYILKDLEEIKEDSEKYIIKFLKDERV